jgi:hypothetical protein
MATKAEEQADAFLNAIREAGVQESALYRNGADFLEGIEDRGLTQLYIGLTDLLLSITKMPSDQSSQEMGKIVTLAQKISEIRSELDNGNETQVEHYLLFEVSEANILCQLAVGFFTLGTQYQKKL